MNHYEGICDVCGEKISLDHDPDTSILGVGIDQDGRMYTWARHINGPKDECSLYSSRVYAEGDDVTEDSPDYVYYDARVDARLHMEAHKRLRESLDKLPPPPPERIRDHALWNLNQASQELRRPYLTHHQAFSLADLINDMVEVIRKVGGINMTVKADIISVGSFDEHGNPIGWIFGYGEHAKSGGVGLMIDTYNNILYAGYTVDELREIAANHPMQAEEGSDETQA